jgi:hypothetical protein
VITVHQKTQKTGSSGGSVLFVANEWTCCSHLRLGKRQSEASQQHVHQLAVRPTRANRPAERGQGSHEKGSRRMERPSWIFQGMALVSNGEKKRGPRATKAAGGPSGCTIGTPSAGLSLGRVARQQSPPLFRPARQTIAQRRHRKQDKQQESRTARRWKVPQRRHDLQGHVNRNSPRPAVLAR